MNWEIFKQATLSTSQTDISDEVIKVSGLKVEYTRTRRHIITHPTITIKNIGNEAMLGQYLKIDIDKETRFLLFVEKVTPNNDNLTTVLECWDILYKLQSVYLADFDSTFWTGYTPSNVTEYRTGSSTQENWITAAFLFRVMLAYVSDVTVANTTDIHYAWDTLFVGNNSGGTPSTLGVDQVGFGWDQLTNIGKSDRTEPNYKSLTLLDVYLFLSEVLQISAHITPDGSGGWEYAINNTSIYTVPTVIGSFSDPPIDVYNGVDVKVSRLTTFNVYSSFTSSDFYDESFSSIVTGQANFFTKTFPRSMFLGRIFAGIINDLDLYGGIEFAEQVQVIILSFYTTPYKAEKSEVAEVVAVRPLKNEYNIAKKSCFITVLEEIT